MQTQSVACKHSQKLWQGQRVKQFPPNIQNRALQKLRMLDSGRTINDLKIPPSNHLEKLLGNRKGRLSIRINDQWRICFLWNDETGNAEQVEITDYH
ncbi:MAG: type II toxin-antitoxin system RelE/ParE family toxin [Alphaproteobacteria bacterium]